jgi:hypothetical protein
MNNKTKKLEGKFIKYNVKFNSVPFDSPFTFIPENKQTTTTNTTITKNILDNINLDEFGTYSNDGFFNGSGTSFIPNILTNKISDYTQFPVINKILEFEKYRIC